LLELRGGFMGQAGKHWGFALVVTALAVTGVLTALGIPQFHTDSAWRQICLAFLP